MAEQGEGFRPIGYYTNVVTIEELRRRGNQRRTGEAWSEPVGEDYFEMFIGGNERAVSLIHECIHWCDILSLRTTWKIRLVLRVKEPNRQAKAR